MKYDGVRYHDSLGIMRAFESIEPDPPIFPAEPELRARVEQAARWSDGDFQCMGRRLLWSHIVRKPGAMMSFAQGEKMPIPMSVSRPLLKPVAMVASRYNRASEQNVRDDLAKLPSVLDRVDELVADGTIGGPQPNVADFLIGASLSLWLTLDDLRPYIEDRPGGQLATRLFPDYKGRVESGVLPSTWFDPLRQAETAASDT
jgi:glutathione S-transferase